MKRRWVAEYDDLVYPRSQECLHNTLSTLDSVRHGTEVKVEVVADMGLLVGECIIRITRTYICHC